MAVRRVAIVVKGYPRLSETFIAQEILGLERRGVQCLIVSLRQPTDPAVHAINRAIRAPVLYLPEYLRDDPPRLRAGRRAAAAMPGFKAAEAAFRRDLARDPSPSRWRRWGQAQILARELPPDVSWIHVHYLHTPASVARYAALLTGRRWSFSAHAKDIWTTPDWELSEKLGDAAWGVTCTRTNRDHLAALAPRPDIVSLLYHGLDFARFAAAPPPDRSSRRGPLGVLTVGRAVEKKGIDVLLRALARIGREIDWRFEHIGGGLLLPRLRALADRLGIADRVTWRGALEQSEVLEAYRRADLFVLPSRVARSGDRDGLPNVLMEAQAMALPCIATDVSAIPELIDDGGTGLLVPPNEPAALAAAILQLARDPGRRHALGHAAAARVRRDFSAEPGFDWLAARLGEALSRAA